MNYPGLEHLRADVAALSNAMCDVRMLLNPISKFSENTRIPLLAPFGSRPALLSGRRAPLRQGGC